MSSIATHIKNFYKIESASGILLFVVSILSLFLAQILHNEAFHNILHVSWSISLFNIVGSISIEEFINDALMAIFFFVIGLEVKRELIFGELNSVSKATLPIIAAIGGMVVPAAIFLLFQHGTPSAHGWGIPMATDIAFVVGAMSLLGKRVPYPLKILVLSLATADDIGAVLVIAFGYTVQIFWGWLFCGAIGVVIFGSLFKLKLRTPLFHVLVFALTWICFFRSGVHATIAGVLLGLVATTRDPTKGKERSPDIINNLIHAIHPWVSFGIMPIFAFANAGVKIDLASAQSGLITAVALALTIGKPLGIVTFSLAASKFKIGKLSESITLRHLVGGGFLSGIGFTMSLFITSLSLTGHLIDEAKIGVLCGSLLSAVIGMALFLYKSPSKC